MNHVVQARRYSMWSWLALGMGMVCFICVFGGPLRIVLGNIYAALILGLVSLAGFVVSAVGLTRRSEKKALLWISLGLSFSPFIYKALLFVGLLTGWISFAP